MHAITIFAIDATVAAIAAFAIFRRMRLKLRHKAEEARSYLRD
jgi:hypothetical protein